MRTLTPGQPPSGSSTRSPGRSSHNRNMSPPAIHSAAVVKGYSATNASSSLSAICIPALLAASPEPEQTQHDRRDDERPGGEQQPELDRVRAVEQPGGEQQRGHPQDRPEHERRDQPRSRRRAQRPKGLVEPVGIVRAGQSQRDNARDGSRGQPRQGRLCPPGPAPDQPASRAAKAAIPAAPQCHEGSARSRCRLPSRFSYQNAPRRSRAAPARRPASADRAAARLAAGSRPARATSSRTQPIPAAPLSSPTWTGTVASPGSSAQADPAIATDRSHTAARRATSRDPGSPGASEARRVTHPMPAAPRPNPP